MKSRNPSVSSTEITSKMLAKDLQSYKDRRRQKATDRLIRAYATLGESIAKSGWHAVVLPVLMDPRMKTLGDGDTVITAKIGLICPYGSDSYSRITEERPLKIVDFEIQPNSPFYPGIGLMRINPHYTLAELYPYAVKLHVKTGRVDFINSRYIADIFDGHKSYKVASWKDARYDLRWILRQVVDISINYADVYKLVQTMFALSGLWGRDHRFSDHSTSVLEYAASVVISEQPWAQEILTRYIHQ